MATPPVIRAALNKSMLAPRLCALLSPPLAPSIAPAREGAKRKRPYCSAQSGRSLISRSLLPEYTGDEMIAPPSTMLQGVAAVVSSSGAGFCSASVAWLAKLASAMPAAIAREWRQIRGRV